jgi:Ubiquitin family
MAAAAEERVVVVEVRTLLNATPLEIGPPSTTIAEVTAILEEELGVARDAQRVMFSGRQLEDRQTLADYNIDTDAKLMVVARLTGFLHIHVSLAGQEPSRDTGGMTLNTTTDHSDTPPLLHTFVLDSGLDRVLALTAGEVVDYCCGFSRVMALAPESVSRWELRRSRPWNGSDERAGDAVDVSMTVRELLAELDGLSRGQRLLLQPNTSANTIKSVHKR